MKLSEYFEYQHSQKMQAHTKNELFSRIQKEKNGIEISTRIPSKIFFFASKRIMYTSLATIIVFIIFGGVLLDKNEVVDFGIFSVKQNSTPNGVFADYVAEIVEFNGEYSLERDGKAVLNLDNLKIIQDGDTIYLPEGTDLIFNLQDGTQAKIIGPAEFSITKTEEKGYQISLFDGKFFKIYCPECSSDVEIITPDFSISQVKDQTLDLHIAKEENGEMLVKNEGDKVTVKTKNSEKETEVKQISSELVAINPDINTINVVENEEVMLNFMAKNNISATFTLSTEDVQWPTVKNEEKNNFIAMQTEQEHEEELQGNIKSEQNEQVINENIVVVPEENDPLLEGLKEIISSNTTEIGEIDEDIALQLGLLSDDSQKVPTAEQMQSLKTSLNSFFLMNIFESIYNQDNADQSISRLADRINSISSTFGYSHKASSDLSSIKSTIQSLKNQLENDRYISPSYVLQLEKVANWCDELQNPSKSDWESLKSDLPTNLRLM